MTRSAAPSADDTYDIADHEWIPVGAYKKHICCDCGLAHKVKYRIHEGVVQEQWIRDEKETKSQRKAGGRKSN